MFDKILRLLGIRKDITLDQLDQIMLRHVDGQLDNITASLDKPKKCSECEGELTVILPQILMNGLVLHECASCHRRVYTERIGT